MKAILREARPRREWWALMVRGASKPLPWTLSSSRAEARELRAEHFGHHFRGTIDVVKVNLILEVKP